MKLMPVYQRGEDLELGMGGDVESKYKKMYEDDINPFTAFSKKVVTHLAMSAIINSTINMGLFKTAYFHFCVHLLMLT